MPRKRHRFLKILLFVGLVPLGGCQITAVFFVEKAWDVSPGFTSANPDMKTRASVEVKLYDSEAKKKAAAASK
jgi:hypothetical protein